MVLAPLIKKNLMKLLTTLFAAIAFLSCNEKQAEQKATAESAKTEVSDAETAQRAEIVTYAKGLLGTKYCYAGADPVKGFDCSGFVNYVFKNFGIELPRSSSGFEAVGPALKPNDIKVGDVLVFYGYQDKNRIGHVGIVCEANGMKSKFIHSSSGKEMAVMISDLGSDQYTKRFYKAVDVIGI